MSQKLSIPEVNALGYEEFIDRFGGAVEHGRLVAAAAWSARPFLSASDLHFRFCEFLDQLSQAGKEAVLRMYPDLAGKLANSGGLTEESVREHKAAGLDSLSADEHRTLSELNEAYKTKFGFPFVICARENKKDAIIQGLKRRMENDVRTEAVTGVNEVKKICHLRLQDLAEDSTSKM
ncbi:2-oxo-4-hydroxy-4-carboxy-5-ureidoimidazoline decarboxylase-like [Dreissena polymorpha]|uniref:2-oxo-4-hydroxy-4-carboxy-5-ureidoimidazoline decarboxylase n=1 Tax=Dreissena polymorpha TaxID=45954 RepID=A0A9D4JR63_DREPO|nr:2-oxo-4-hydroxy-4-carboxy-5-ureidoimidazoline decarboxylase-like [Dreissena polymorpha]KAH3821316.1 hypothetical protein DPMN_123079 [Dreissena polymorpha]